MKSTITHLYRILSTMTHLYRRINRRPLTCTGDWVNDHSPVQEIESKITHLYRRLSRRQHRDTPLSLQCRLWQWECQPAWESHPWETSSHSAYQSASHQSPITRHTIQYNTIICNTCMVGRRAESGVWAIARGEDGEASLKESTERIIRLKVRLRRGKQ